MQRVAIVTGTSSGIGRALAEDFLSKGWRVGLADVNESETALSHQTDDNSLFQKVDVSSWEDQAALFAAVTKRWGRLDYVAANAGIDEKTSFYKQTPGPEPIKPDLRTIDVDLISVLYSLRLALHYFRLNETPGGVFVATSSSAGLYPGGPIPLYCTAKAGIINLVRSAAGQLGPENISVNAVCPAFVLTGLPPALLAESWPKEHLTPVETIVRAFRNFADDPALTGKIAECSQNDIFYRDQVPYPNQSQKWVLEESGELWEKVYPKTV